MNIYIIAFIAFLVGLMAGCFFTNLEKERQERRELIIDELMKEWDREFDKCNLEKNGTITADNCDISYLDKCSKD